MSNQNEMDQERILQAARAYAHAQLANDPTGHDWHHVERVTRLAVHIAQEEGAGTFVVELTALLHDIADYKLVSDPQQAMNDVRAWLASQGADEGLIGKIVQIIEAMSFKGADTVLMSTPEGQIVREADLLDAMGAIGIARTFTYGGSIGRPIHNPEEAPRQQMTEAEYKSHQTTTIAHFHEKLLKLRDLMSTATAKRLAAHRHTFLEGFLSEFEAEWKGER